MSKAAKWAVIRREAPVMPWDDADGLGEKSFFRRLAAQLGTAYALNVWEDADSLFSHAPPQDEPERVKVFLAQFRADLIERRGEAYDFTFWHAMKALRLHAWGIRHELRLPKEKAIP